MRRGLISKTDANTIEATLKLIILGFQDEIINTCEVGILDGSTSTGIHEYIVGEGRKNHHTAIDNEQYQKIQSPFAGCNLIIGDSKYVYNRLADGGQHFIFIDGCHNFPSVVADFYCYAPKVKVGGYMAFHDTAPHIKPFTDYQHYGDKNDQDMYISVRKALTSISMPNMSVIFDDCDVEDEAGGVIVYKRLW